jgi:sugar O-acyltransferase (sialic acid O-acetyltransferase NeuD family)
VITESLPPIILVGGGGHCISCIDVIEAERRFAIAGFVIASQDHSNGLLDYPILGNDRELPELLATGCHALVTVGQIKTARVRQRLYEMLVRLEAKIPVIKSPFAHVSKYAELGVGTIAMHGVIVNARSNVGENCIVNSHALIEHGVRVGDHCHVSTGARINGDVNVGEGCFIGSGVVIRQGVTIGSDVFIDAGQVVLTDIPSGSYIRSSHAK